MAEIETIIYEVRVLEQTPIGPLTVYVSDGGLARIDFGRLVEVRTGDAELEKLADLAVQELTEYFYAGRRNFSLGNRLARHATVSGESFARLPGSTLWTGTHLR